MLGRRSQSAIRLVVLCLAVLAVCLGSRSASAAEQMIIERPGDHPVYSVEAEPHLALSFLFPEAGKSGVGVGGRFTLPIVKNGFVPSINNSVGIGLGLDWIHYNGCHYWSNPNACSNLETFWFPVVLQWNFWLSTHWSVFGEGGITLAYNAWGSGCVDFYIDNGQQVSCGPTPSHLAFDPIVLFFGGRYHFNETTSLTMRIGWPYSTIGVSFFP
jgi:hypothetical protein